MVQATESWGEAKGIYRFFNNARVYTDRILLSHRKATVERIRGQRIVLAAQDTTAMSFNSLQATQGLGPIGAANCRGFFLHSALAMDVNGVPLGLLAARFWARDSEGEEPAEKESRRWVETVREVRAIVPEDTRVIVIGDRESDFFAVFAEAGAVGADVLVRATHKLAEGWPDLAAALGRAPLLGTMEADIPRGHDHPERHVTLALHAQAVQLQPPADLHGAEPIRMTVVSASEIAPPEGETPVGWVLLTTLQAETVEQAAVVVR